MDLKFKAQRILKSHYGGGKRFMERSEAERSKFRPGDIDETVKYIFGNATRVRTCCIYL